MLNAVQDLAALQRGAAGIALSADIDFGVRRLVAESQPAAPDWLCQQAHGKAFIDLCCRSSLALIQVATAHVCSSHLFNLQCSLPVAGRSSVTLK